MEQSNGYWRSTANRQEQENKKKNEPIIFNSINIMHE